MRLLRPALLLLGCLLLAGCGSKVPPGDVAVVEGAPSGNISKAQFNHWLSVAAARPSSSLPAGVPDSPSFKLCSRGVKPVSLPRGQKIALCRRRYQNLKDQTMQFLISSRWIAGQAQKEGVNISEAEVNNRLEAQIKKSFPKPGQLQKFLSEQEMTRRDLLFRTRLNLAAAALRARATSRAPKPSAKQIEEFYQDNLRRFGQPASREVQIITTKNRQKALLVRALLDRGADFSRLARKYSEDKSSAAQGGRLTISFGRIVGPDLERAVFSAPLGKIEGPVQGGYVYYLFRVLKKTPSRRQPLSKVKPLVVELLSAQLKRQQASRYLSRLEQEWRPRTLCAPGYIIKACSN